MHYLLLLFTCGVILSKSYKKRKENISALNEFLACDIDLAKTWLMPFKIMSPMGQGGQRQTKIWTGQSTHYLFHTIIKFISHYY